MRTKFLFLIIVLFGITSCKGEEHVVKKSERMRFAPNTVLIPDAVWPDVYFDGIFDIVKKARLVNLRSKRIDDEGVEIRIWFNYDHFIDDLQIKGVILERKPELKYSGVLIKDDSGKVEKIDNVLGGWSLFFQSLKEEGIFELPGGSKIEPGRFPLQGGAFFIVEILEGTHYRTYGYYYYQLQEEKHGVKMKRILLKVFQVLGLQSPFIH
jgi:hypothetical protein